MLRPVALGVLIGAGLLLLQYLLGQAVGRFAFGAFMVTVVLPGLLHPTRD